MAEATLESLGREADEAPAGRAERRQAAKRQAAKASRLKAREADEVAYRAQRARWERERPGNKRQRAAAAAAPGTAQGAETQQVTAAYPDARLQHFLHGVASAAEAAMVGSGNDPLSYFLFTVRAAALASAAMAQAPGSGAQAPPVPFQTPPAGALQPQLARTLSEAEATAAACGGITVARAVLMPATAAAAAAPATSAAPSTNAAANMAPAHAGAVERTAAPTVTARTAAAAAAPAATGAAPAPTAQASRGRRQGQGMHGMPALQAAAAALLGGPVRERSSARRFACCGVARRGAQSEYMCAVCDVAVHDPNSCEHVLRSADRADVLFCSDTCFAHGPIGE